MAAIALLYLAASLAPPLKQPELPRPNDGFIYPGDPGSEGISDYYRRYGEELSRIGKAPAGRPAALESLAWMQGCWDAELRDYDYEPPAPMKIVELGRGVARISFTPDQHWLRIETTIVDRWMGRYIGFDRAAGALVMRQIGNPITTQHEAFRSPGWRGDNLTFGPAAQSMFKLPLTDQVTFVRSGKNFIRVVVQGRVASGKFVAMDDLVLRRVVADRCANQTF